MIELRPYPAMKDSGAPWLGDVPEHWAVPKLGYLGRLSKGNGGSKEDAIPAGVPCVRYGDLYTTHTHFIRGSRSFVSPARATHYTPIQYGDVLFAASGETIDEIGKSAVNLISTKACCGGDIILLRPTVEMNARYLGYAADCRPSAIQKATMGRGITVKHIYGDQLKNLALPLPPLAEQAAIVRFLNYVDRRVRHYIRAKRKLIELLEEQKQVIIHRVVTRGLDPNVRLKPSGGEWLGDVPEHWDIVTLRRVIHRAVDGPHHSPSYTDEGIPFLSARNIKADRWSLDDAKSISEDDYLEFCRRIVPELGDVLYTKGGTTGVARAVDLSFRFQVWVHVAVLKVAKDKVIPEFLATSLNAPRCYEQSQLYTRGATNQDLGLNRMKNILLTLPPLSEQSEILSYLDGVTRELGAARDRAQRETSLLREFRTRLIADVVTGKLDVREAAARLPDEPADPDAPDEPNELIDAEPAPLEDGEALEEPEA